MNYKTKETIKCLEERVYNLNRPFNIIISELIEVILYLLNEIRRLKKKIK